MNVHGKNKDPDAISISKFRNNHEKSTLPDGLGILDIDRPVMYAAPAPKAGLRSEGTPLSAIDESGAAGSVTPSPMSIEDLTTAADSAMRARDGTTANNAQPTGAMLSNVIDIPISRSQAFEIVKKVRVKLIEYVEARRARKDTTPSAETLTDYDKKCREIDSRIVRMDPGEPNPIFSTMVQLAGHKKTFAAYKSALKHQAIQRLVETMSAQNRIQRIKGKESEWLDSIIDVRKALFAYETIERLNYAESLLWLDRKPGTSKSKKKDLPRLKSNWRQVFLDANVSSEKYRHASVLLNFCGLRPRELELGVEVVALQAGIEITIQGAKVRSTAGQPWRKFLLDPRCLPLWFVQQAYQIKRMTIVARSGALRSHLKRQSELVFRASGNPEDSSPVLSAYTFRHSLVTDLREQGWSSAEIAAAIGETTTQMTSNYGMRTRSKKVAPNAKAIVKSSVECARQVRQKDMVAFNQLLLDKNKKLGKRT